MIKIAFRIKYFKNYEKNFLRKIKNPKKSFVKSLKFLNEFSSIDSGTHYKRLFSNLIFLLTHKNFDKMKFEKYF